MMADIGFLTGEYRIDLMVRREPVATYRYAPGMIPGFSAFCAVEGRMVSALDAFSGQALWLAHGGIDGISCGIPLENEDTRAEGTIVSADLTARRGAQSVGFQQECLWVGPDGKVLLQDRRSVRVTPGPSEGSVFDILIRLYAPNDKSVLLGREEKTLLRFRGAPTTLPSGGGQLRNSKGNYGPEEMQGQIAAWCAGVGVVRGETVGWALLDHPSNRWHPPRWTVSPDGLIAPQPFAWSALELEPHDPFQLRYRLYVYQNYIDAGWADARLAEFAEEPVWS